jgi:hypothetical protein
MFLVEAAFRDSESFDGCIAGGRSWAPEIWLDMDGLLAGGGVYMEDCFIAGYGWIYG